MWEPVIDYDMNENILPKFIKSHASITVKDCKELKVQ